MSFAHPSLRDSVTYISKVDLLGWVIEKIQKERMWEIECYQSSRSYFITLVSAICPVSMSPLIQQRNKLNWKHFIVYNSFMVVPLIHWGEQLNGC